MTEDQIKQELRTAIKKNDFARFKQLMQEDPSRVTLENVFGTWLHQAASFNRVEFIQYILSLGLDINQKSGIANGTALSLAAADGHLEAVELLMTQGAQFDVRVSEGNALFSAIYAGSLPIVKTLIEAGFDHHIKYSGPTVKNMDALMFARERGQTEIANYLAALDPAKPT